MMNDQLSLLDAPQFIDCLLVALLPPANEADQIDKIRSLLIKQNRSTGYVQKRPHLTMHHVGDFDRVPDSVVKTATDALAAVKAPPFDISFDCAMSFNNGKNNPFVMRASGDLSALSSLHRQLGDALKKAGLGRHVSSTFTPHMTLHYDHRVFPEQTINTVSWTVMDFVLVNSRQGRGEHIHLARFPLRG